MKRLLTAIQFLTLIPVPLRQPGPLSQSAPFFPLVGALLGSCTGLLLILLQPHLGTPLASLLALTALLMVTGCLHEEGLSDIADACRAGRSRETMLRILKDSRIGAYGALALLASFLLRWQALTLCRRDPVLGLLAALALSRAALVVLAAISPSIGEGLGADFIRHLSARLFVLTTICGLALALLSARLTGLWMAVATALIILAARSYFLKRLGGVNGDCLGATCQIVETVNLLILAWQPSI